MRVILTYGRAWSALAATRSLGKRGVEVIAGDEYEFAPAALSKYTIAKFIYPNPDLEPERFLDTLEEVIRKHQPPDGEEYVLMPVHKEAYLIARHRARFEPLIKMALIHHQFETIHPFYDGNGRTGRIINILYLVKHGLLDTPVLYMSRYIVRTKPDYYRLLQSVRPQP